MVHLALTPPAFTTRTAYSNEQLFNVIAGLRGSRTLKDKLLLREVTMPFEITSTRSGGICFSSRVDTRYAASVAQDHMTALPEIRIAETPSQASSVPRHARVLELKQTGAWYLPFADQTNLEQHDPVAYITGVMSKLRDKEIMGVQVIVTPAKIRNAGSVAYKVMRNEDVLSRASHKHSIWPKLAHGINAFLFGVLDVLGEAYHGSSTASQSSAQRNSHEQMQVARNLKPARSLSQSEQERISAVHHKVAQPLFRVTIRVMVAADNPEATNARLAAIKASFVSYDTPGYQGLRPRLRLPFMDHYRRFAYQHGLPALFKRHSCILSSSELASLYHFPIGTNMKVDNLDTSLSRTLPAPISLKQRNVLDVIIGRNYHHGVETDIGLTPAERERHVYIIGGTGNGKTTMLEYAIVQDMHSGKGIAVVDPHGDLAETILRHVPEERIDDVIYLNPDDLMYPIGINLLELRPDLAGDELLREKDLITESTISVMRKIFSDDDSGGHRIEYVLRNTIQTALTIEDATLFTIFDLLNDTKFRRKIVKGLQDKDLKNFWDNELGKAGEFQRVKMAAGITAKIGRFLFSASAKRILEQPQSTVDFDEILNSGKILICNFSKGLLGEDTSTLFGTTILAKLQMAALRRARLQQTDRTPYYLYVDEFQNFATMAFVQMLSEARKYKLYLTMAEQSTTQQDQQRLVEIILANVGTVICFRSGSPADERLILPLFSPFINKGEIANLPTFNFYVRIAAVKAQEPLSGKTMLLDSSGSEITASRVIDQSRNSYGLRDFPEEKDIVKEQVIAKLAKQPSEVSNTLNAESLIV
jgi:hypothetical protein